MSTNPKFDEKLWFTLKNCCQGKHYLLHNPHTFPGRMGAWCPQGEHYFNVSKSEIDDCSLEATYWIKGFLSGNEPHAPLTEQGDYFPEDSQEFIRWQLAVKQFPETGLWIVGQERTCEICNEVLLPTQPGLQCDNCAEADDND